MLSNNCSILLIDDDADVLDAYTQLLEQAGYHVSACNNPFDAREQVPKDWPGIVLSDVCMPGCSGIDLMTLFHQDDDLLPILLITGHGDVPMAVEAVKKGAWDFLQKPIDPGKLLTLVDAALRQRQSVIARRQYCQQKLQVEGSVSPAPSAAGRNGYCGMALRRAGNRPHDRRALPAPVRTAR